VRILHVIQGFHPGGGFRALTALAAQCLAAGGGEHRLAGLTPPVPGAGGGPGGGVDLARRAGLTVLEAHDPASLRGALEASDIVHLHYWNTPEMDAFLRSGLPPMRLLATMHIGGEHAPQVITPELVAFADRIQNTGPFAMDRAVFAALPPEIRREKVSLTFCPADLARLDGVRPVAHAGFCIAYVGSVDFAKLHPDFVALCASIRTPGARFVVTGPGRAYPELRRQAEAAGLAGRMEFLGELADIAPVLAAADVFGYPLCADNYSSGELILQEVAHCGLPAVVLDHGGAGRMVEHGVSGLVARGALEYRDAVERLLADPAERASLGQGARELAGRLFAGGRAGRETVALYADMLRRPKRARAFPPPPEAEGFAGALGARRFVQSLGHAGGLFAASMGQGGFAARLDADRRIAAASPVLAKGDGGIESYLRFYPDDPLLLYWAGLTALARGEADAALVRLVRAGRQGLDGLEGLDGGRAAMHAARAARLLGEADFAEALGAGPEADAAGFPAPPDESPAGAALRDAASPRRKFAAFRALGEWDRAAALAFGPLLAERGTAGWEEARDQLYRFGLERHRAGRLDLAARAYAAVLAPAEEGTDQAPELSAWAQFKLGELLLDQGDSASARERFLAALALKPDLAKARLCLIPADERLCVSIGGAAAGHVAVSLDALAPEGAGLWEYHFARRRPDALRLGVTPELGPDGAERLAGLALRWLAPDAVLTLVGPLAGCGIAPAVRAAFARHFPPQRLRVASPE